MERIYEMIADARAKKASDIHISEGLPVWYRINGRLLPAEAQFQGSGIRGMLEALLDEKHRAAFDRGEDADFSLTTPGGIPAESQCIPAAEEAGSHHPSSERFHSLPGRTEDAHDSL